MTGGGFCNVEVNEPLPKSHKYVNEPYPLYELLSLKVVVSGAGPVVMVATNAGVTVGLFTVTACVAVVLLPVELVSCRVTV